MHRVIKYACFPFMQKRHFSMETEKWRCIKSALFLFGKIVFSVKLLYASGCVQNLLFTGVKGMAHVAYINLQVGLGRLGFKCIAACTFDDDFFVFRMYSLFHLSVSLRGFVILQ